MDEVSYRGAAHGRVCLLGEHCDWAYADFGFEGGACLAIPLSRGVSVTVRAARSGWSFQGMGVRSETSVGGALDARDPNRYLASVARTLLADGLALGPFELVCVSDLPAGRGFSSSAAVSVAASRALGLFVGTQLTDLAAADVAYRSERFGLGVACGRMDPLACAITAPLYIEWAEGAGPAPSAAPSGLPVVAAAFEGGRPAGELLSALSAAYHTDSVQRAVACWAAEARLGAAALGRGDLRALGACMDRAQAAYEGLSLPECQAPGLVAACVAAREDGALGAKFSGAGGDRSMVCLYEDMAAAERGRALLRARGLLVL